MELLLLKLIIKNKSAGSTVIKELKINDEILYSNAPLNLYNGETLSLKKDFKFNENKIHFSVAATDYTNENQNTYRYRLTNHEKNVGISQMQMKLHI